MSEPEENGRTQRPLWYTRRDGRVRGPFPESLLRRYVLLGRVGAADEVSRDRQSWTPLESHPELIPELVTAARDDEQARARLMAARLREDERDVSDRRAGRAAGPGGAERRGGERRESEPDWMLRYRRLRARTRAEGSPQRARYGVVLGILALVGGLLWYAAVRAPEPGRSGTPKCSAPPRPGIDWSYCTLEGLRLAGANLRRANLRSADLRGADLAGARLAGADLSYAGLGTADLARADLAHARLVGTGLGGADLRGADLAGSNLSYANLRGARLEGARLAGANLDQAIWTDGRVCAEGSVGGCR